MEAQAELFDPAFDYVALCLQMARRYEKVGLFLVQQTKLQLYSELSLSALLLDRAEASVTTSTLYQRSVLVAPLYHPEALERAEPAWHTHWLARRNRDRGRSSGP